MSLSLDYETTPGVEHTAVYGLPWINLLAIADQPQGPREPENEAMRHGAGASISHLIQIRGGPLNTTKQLGPDIQHRVHCPLRGPDQPLGRM